MEDDKNEKDRQIIEDYLKEHNIEGVLDEVINNIIERRPQNPYVELSKLLETKTKPEIIEVNITSILSGCSSYGIRATVLTNAGTFTGETALPFIPHTSIPAMRDFTAEQVKIEDAIRNLNPLNFPAIDEALFQLQGVDNYILLAVSIACIRGASKFRGLSLYQYISELAGTEPQIPLPVCTLLSRCVGDPVEKQVQNIHLYPIQTISFSNAVETLLQGVDRVHKDLFTPVATIQIVETPHPVVVPAGKKGAAAAAAAAPPQPQQIVIPPQPAIPLTVPINGSLNVLKQTLDAILKAINVSLKNEPSMLSRLKLSVDYKAQTLYKMSIPKNSKGEPIPNAEEELVYNFNGLSEASTSGSDTIDSIINQLKEYNLISFEDPLHSKDIRSLRLLKERIAQTIEAWKDDSSTQSDHSYSLHGIGGDEGCNVQIIADQGYTQSEEIRQYANEAVYNAINIHFDKIFSIMKAIDLCKTAHEIGWSVIISTSKYTPETIELFLSDFAVGIGSSQFIIGGIHSIEYSMKFNRIFNIISENDSIHYAGNDFRK